jgi:hypothetical protein
MIIGIEWPGETDGLNFLVLRMCILCDMNARAIFSRGASVPLSVALYALLCFSDAVPLPHVLCRSPSHPAPRLHSLYAAGSRADACARVEARQPPHRCRLLTVCRRLYGV